MLGGPLERSGFPPPAGSFTPPRCGLFLLRRSQSLGRAGASGLADALPCVTAATTAAEPHGLASIRGRLVARLGRLIDGRHRWTTRALCPVSGHRIRCVLLFLWDLSIDATNRAEQGPSRVVIRKVDVATAPATAPTASRCWPASCAPPATRPRSTSADRHDVARHRSRRPRRLRAPPAARLRVGEHRSLARREDRQPRDGRFNCDRPRQVSSRAGVKHQ